MNPPDRQVLRLGPSTGLGQAPAARPLVDGDLVELQLTPIEVVHLARSPRCAACGHLKALHGWSVGTLDVWMCDLEGCEQMAWKCDAAREEAEGNGG